MGKVQRGYEPVVRDFLHSVTRLPQVITVFLFGSVATGKAEKRHSDVDFLVVVSGKKIAKSVRDKIEDIAASLPHEQEVHVELQPEKTITQEDASLLQTVFSQGILLFTRKLWVVDMKQLGFKPYILLSYHSKEQKNYNRFIGALFGKISSYTHKGIKKTIKYEGIASKLGIEKVGRGVILFQKAHLDAVLDLCLNYGIKFDFKEVWF